MSLVAREDAVKYAVTFVIATGLVALVPYYFSIEFGLRRYYVAFLMWTPALGLVITSLLLKFDIKKLAWKWPRKRWLLSAYLIPILYGGIAYGIIWGGGLGGLFDAKFVDRMGYVFALSGWSTSATIAFSFVMVGTIGMFWHLITSFGEELGWRGFLTPVLMARFSMPVASTLTGLVWAAWHVPLILYADYNAGPTGLGLQIVKFTIMTVGLSFIMTYLVVRAESHWPATILHASHNVYILTLFDDMTIKYKGTTFYAGEFGLILPIIVSLVAAICWYRYNNEEKQVTHETELHDQTTPEPVG